MLAEEGQEFIGPTVKVSEEIATALSLDMDCREKKFRTKITAVPLT